MDLVIFEENRPFVLQSLGNGDFDYIESASEVYEADFFRFIKARTILDKLAETYPTQGKFILLTKHRQNGELRIFLDKSQIMM